MRTNTPTTRDVIGSSPLHRFTVHFAIDVPGYSPDFRQMNQRLAEGEGRAPAALPDFRQSTRAGDDGPALTTFDARHACCRSTCCEEAWP